LPKKEKDNNEGNNRKKTENNKKRTNNLTGRATKTEYKQSEDHVTDYESPTENLKEVWKLWMRESILGLHIDVTVSKQLIID